MEAFSTLFFVLALLFSFSAQAAETCNAGDPACARPAAGDTGFESGAVENGPTKREVVGGKPACAACVAQNASKNGPASGGGGLTEPSGASK